MAFLLPTRFTDAAAAAVVSRPRAAGASRHDAFISYSRRDKAFATALEKALRRYKPPAGLAVEQRYLEVFRDESDFTAGDYGEVLERALDCASCLVVVCSPNARRSDFVDDEIRRFAATHGSSRRIVPVLIDGIPDNEALEGQEERLAFPKALRELMEMPLAVSYLGCRPGIDDLRGGAFEGSWYALLASILDVSRAQIEERDKARRARVRNVRIAASAAIAASFTALGLWTFSFRNKAVTQQDASTAHRLQIQGRAVLEGREQGRTDLALLFSAASYRLDPSNEAYESLQHALDATAGQHKVVGIPGIAAVSGDGSTAVARSGEKSQRLRVWDVASGLPRTGVLEAHTDYVWDIVFSPDGRLFASASQDATIRVWDSNTGRSHGEPLRGHTAAVERIAWSADGRTLASWSWDRTLRLWDVATGQPRADPLSERVNSVRSLAFGADGRTLVSGSIDGTVQSRDSATGRPRGEALRGHTAEVGVVAIAPGGRVVASGSRDGAVRLWKFDDPASPASVELKGHVGAITALAFSGDGRRLASGGADKTIRIWDVEAGTSHGAGWRGHGADVIRLLFAANADALISASRDGTLRVWDIVSPAGPPASMRAAGAITATASSSDGSTFAAGLRTGALQAWNARNRTVIEPAATRHEGMVLSLAVSADGSVIASAGGDNKVGLWSLDGERLRAMRMGGASASVSSVVLSGDGRTLAVGSGDGTVELMDVASGQRRGGPIAAHAGPVMKMQFGPGGGLLASSGADRTIRIRDVRLGNEVGRPPADGVDIAMALAFSPDGAKFAAGDIARTVHIFETGTGRRLHSFKAHDAEVTSVSFSPDGATLATASTDATVRFWDVAGGKARGAPVKGPAAGIGNIEFTSDGERLIAVGADLEIRTIDVPALWISRVCEKVVRNLSRAEWKQLVGDIAYVVQCPGSKVPPDH
jgi:WD40 repeat protein